MPAIGLGLGLAMSRGGYGAAGPAVPNAIIQQLQGGTLDGINLLDDKDIVNPNPQLRQMNCLAFTTPQNLDSPAVVLGDKFTITFSGYVSSTGDNYGNLFINETSTAEGVVGIIRAVGGSQGSLYLRPNGSPTNQNITFSQGVFNNAVHDIVITYDNGAVSITIDGSETTDTITHYNGFANADAFRVGSNTAGTQGVTLDLYDFAVIPDVGDGFHYTSEERYGLPMDVSGADNHAVAMTSTYSTSDNALSWNALKGFTKAMGFGRTTGYLGPQSNITTGVSSVVLYTKFLATGAEYAHTSVGSGGDRCYTRELINGEYRFGVGAGSVSTTTGPHFSAGDVVEALCVLTPTHVTIYLNGVLIKEQAITRTAEVVATGYVGRYITPDTYLRGIILETFMSNDGITQFHYIAKNVSDTGVTDEVEGLVGQSIGGTFLKGGTHFHTDNTDGVDTPLAMMGTYRTKGYQFASPSDHNFYTTDPGEPVIIYLPNIEETSSQFDMNHLGDSTIYSPLTGQALIDAINAGGAVSVMNHVHSQYKDPMSIAQFLDYTDVGAIEVYNWNSEQLDEPEAEDYWQAALDDGRRMFAFATTDAHSVGNVQNNGPGIMVTADANTEAAIITAVKAGRFYASSGALLDSVILSGNTLFVEVPVASLIEFVGVGGAVLHSATSALTAEYHSSSSDVYVRVRVIRDSDGRKAWSQAFFYEDTRTANDALFFSAAGTAYIPALANGTADATGGIITNPGGYVHNDNECDVIELGVNIVDSIFVTGLTGADAVDNGLYAYDDITNSKPKFLNSTTGGVILWTTSWELIGQSVITHPTASGTFPDKTGWPVGGGGTSPVLAYESFYVEDEELRIFTKADWDEHYATNNGLLNLWIKKLDNNILRADQYPLALVFTAAQLAKNKRFYGGANASGFDEGFDEGFGS